MQANPMHAWNPWMQYIDQNADISSPLLRPDDFDVDPSEGDKIGLYVQYQKRDTTSPSVALIIRSRDDLEPYRTDEFNTEHLMAFNKFMENCEAFCDQSTEQPLAKFALAFDVEAGTVPRESCVSALAYTTPLIEALEARIYFELVEIILGPSSRVRCRPDDFEQAAAYGLFYWDIASSISRELKVEQQQHEGLRKTTAFERMQRENAGVLVKTVQSELAAEKRRREQLQERLLSELAIERTLRKEAEELLAEVQSKLKKAVDNSEELTCSVARVTNNSEYQNNMLLHQAAEHGETVSVEHLLHGGADVNYQNEEGQRSLHIACLYGHHQIVQMLLEARADVEAVDAVSATPQFLPPPFLAAVSGAKPLLLAAKHGHAEVVRALLKGSADPDTKNFEEMKQSALHEAAKEGHVEVIRVLVAAKANIESVDTSGETPLHIAAKAGHPDAVKELISAILDIEARSEDDSTALHLASLHGHREVVEALIKAGAHIESNNMAEYTPLKLAALNGHTAVAEALLAAGADSESTNVAGYTALHIAAVHGRTGVADVLIRADANVEAKNIMHWTPLHLAAEKGHLNLAETLLCAEADFQAKNI
eukprot:gene18540-22132_t